MSPQVIDVLDASISKSSTLQLSTEKFLISSRINHLGAETALLRYRLKPIGHVGKTRSLSCLIIDNRVWKTVLATLALVQNVSSGRLFDVIKGKFYARFLGVLLVVFVFHYQYSFLACSNLAREKGHAYSPPPYSFLPERLSYSPLVNTIVLTLHSFATSLAYSRIYVPRHIGRRRRRAASA